MGQNKQFIDLQKIFSRLLTTCCIHTLQWPSTYYHHTSSPIGFLFHSSINSVLQTIPMLQFNSQSFILIQIQMPSAFTNIIRHRRDTERTRSHPFLFYFSSIPIQCRYTSNIHPPNHSPFQRTPRNNTTIDKTTIRFD